jgi:hypothetical protein
MYCHDLIAEVGGGGGYESSNEQQLDPGENWPHLVRLRGSLSLASKQLGTDHVKIQLGSQPLDTHSFSRSLIYLPDAVRTYCLCTVVFPSIG